MQNFKSTRTYYLIIIGFIIGIYIKNLAFWSKSQTFIFGDTAIYSLYLSAFAKNLSGIVTYKNNFLFWNPSYLSVGLPTLSIVDMGVLYPPNILIAVLAFLFNNVMLTFPLYTISLYIHLIIASIFVFKIINEHWNLEKHFALMGAFLWAFIGYNTEFIAAGAMMLTASYLPICFYFRLKQQSEPRKKYYFAFYSALALSFLAGYPITAVIIYLVCVFFTIFSANSFKFRKLIKSEVLGIFLIVIPLISPLYFPAILNLSYSARTKLNLEGFLSNPAKLTDIIEPIIHKNTPFNDGNSTNFVYLYFSLVGLIAFAESKDKIQILKEKKNRALIIMGLFGLILSLGKVTPLPALLFYLVPGFNFFRRLSVFAIIPSFGFCLLAPQWIKKAQDTKFPSVLFLAVFPAVFIIGGLFLFRAGNLDSQVLQESGLALTSFIVLATYSAFILKKYQKEFFIVGIAVALFIEASVITYSKVPLNSKINPVAIFKTNKLIKTLSKSIGPRERVDILYTQHNYNVNHFGLEQTAGYLSLASNYGVQINNLLNTADYNTKNLRDILGITKIVKKQTDIEGGLEAEQKMAQDEDNPMFFAFNYITRAWEAEPNGTEYIIYNRKMALPRVYLASEVVGIEQSVDILKKIENLSNPKIVFIDKGDIEK